MDELLIDGRRDDGADLVLPERALDLNGTTLCLDLADPTVGVFALVVLDVLDALEPG